MVIQSKLRKSYEIGKDFELKEVKEIKNLRLNKSKPTSFLLIDVGIFIIFPLLVAVFIGLYIDKTLKTKNLFTLILIFLGFVCSIYNLIRLTKKNAENQY